MHAYTLTLHKEFVSPLHRMNVFEHHRIVLAPRMRYHSLLCVQMSTLDRCRPFEPL
jgi:hypothetical protein